MIQFECLINNKIISIVENILISKVCVFYARLPRVILFLATVAENEQNLNFLVMYKMLEKHFCRSLAALISHKEINSRHRHMYINVLQFRKFTNTKLTKQISSSSRVIRRKLFNNNCQDHVKINF